MRLGVLYGVGMGPGDPDLITLKAAKTLARCRHVFAAASRVEDGSTALSIAREYVSSDSRVYELIFPVKADRARVEKHWNECAERIAPVIRGGEDACFLTIGDPLLYSTYIYTVRALRKLIPEVRTVTIPGITSFNAAAALTRFVIGAGEESISIIPINDDLNSVREALLKCWGTAVLINIGKRLPEILDLLEELGVLDQGVFVARAGMEGERIEFNLRGLRIENSAANVFSILLVHREKGSDSVLPILKKAKQQRRHHTISSGASTPKAEECAEPILVSYIMQR